MKFVVKLSKKWQEHLANQPETGMGFQEVEISLHSGDILTGRVINSNILKTDTLVKEDEIANIIVVTRE
jgi:hypothetical protein